MRLARMIALTVAVAVVGSGLALAADGKATYGAKCAMCHGADGTAKEMWAKKGMKSFNDAAWQKSMTDEKIMETITNGIPDKKMPAYKDKLSVDDVKATTAYIRTLAK